MFCYGCLVNWHLLGQGCFALLGQEVAAIMAHQPGDSLNPHLSNLATEWMNSSVSRFHRKSNPASIHPSACIAASCCCLLLDFFCAMTAAASLARSEAVVIGHADPSAFEEGVILFDEA